ncbi:MAG: hypothetical protein HY738_03610 [Bacteroidia bacterium]|nr:hypothetical protein [Bacteroidia bacterium]
MTAIIILLGLKACTDFVHTRFQSLALFIAVIPIVMIIAGCNKYEEGPVISLRSKKERVVNIWKIDKIYIDSAEYPNYLPSDYEIEIKKDGTYSKISSGTTYTGTWEFDEKKELIIFDKGTADEEKPTILKLKEKDLWLQYLYTESNDTHTREIYYIPK